jgi:hypothetical protein
MGDTTTDGYIPNENIRFWPDEKQPSEVSSAGLLSVWVVKDPLGQIYEIAEKLDTAAGRVCSSMNATWPNLKARGWTGTEMFLSDNTKVSRGVTQERNCDH